MQPDLSVKIGRLELKNPVMPASGCFGYGEEYEQFYDLGRLGAIVVKGTTAEARPGNPAPRVAETPAGLLNAIGLQNPGTEEARLKIRRLARYGVPVIVNVAGHNTAEYCSVVEALSAETAVAAFEINVSCPNVAEGGLSFGTDPRTVFRLAGELRKLTEKTLIVKLTPNVTDITEIARAAAEAGADALSLINTLLGMAIDTRSRRPLLANLTGGLSGPAVKPVAVRMVWQVAGCVDLPVIGMGGICCANDALEFMLAGASAVAVGTANFSNPLVCPEIIDGLAVYCREQGFSAVRELVGLARRPAAHKAGGTGGCGRK
ncbi:MAG: Dihydroorotate dehydrogenase B (NAD(+)), catalytic subunit [Syntrophomonadaceae bacterium]|nr:Dihydroorotate dehydrogenase B (NAD(+)), catalytic subunit [Bacillota bacterium]